MNAHDREEIIRRLESSAVVKLLEEVRKMSAQLDALTAAVTTETATLAALTDAIGKIPAQTPPENLQGVIDAINANNATLTAAVASLVALATPPVVPAPPVAAP